MNIYSVIHSYPQEIYTMDFSELFKNCKTKGDYALFLQRVGLRAYVKESPYGRIIGVNLELFSKHASAWANFDIQYDPYYPSLPSSYWLSNFIEIVVNNFESYELDVDSIYCLILADNFRALHLNKACGIDVAIGELMRKFTGLKKIFNTVEDFESR